MAGITALDLPEAYFNSLADAYDARRGIAVDMLTNAGFRCFRPDGAYYVMTDASALGVTDDRTFAEWLIEDIGVAAVPGSSFYSAGQGNSQLRFCFCKKHETLEEAGRKLAAVPGSISRYFDWIKR
jgi:aminotransferase